MADWPEGVGRRNFATLDSTMDEAARQAPSLAGPTWILAHEQTGARGRRGRVWRQPPGNFAATLVYRPKGGIETRALRSFVAALALKDALVAATGRANLFTLKWPNDVLLNGAKVAGILLESRDEALSVGIGVNLAAPPAPDQLEAGALPAVSLVGETGVSVPPEEFLDLLAPAYAAREAALATYGFGPIRTAWLADAANLGRPITARTGTETITGTFDTVDETGMLVLKTPEATRRIAAADIFFPSAS
jgi:BirA family biotin operon repressor/biotin-[acetyl-CoA-carboxylase] ligase